jgi:hypothetical protein
MRTLHPFGISLITLRSNPVSHRKKNRPPTHEDQHTVGKNTPSPPSMPATPETSISQHNDGRPRRHRDTRLILRLIRRWCLQKLKRSWDWNKVVGIGTLALALTSLLGLWYTKQALNDGRRVFEATQRPLVSLGRKDGKLADFVLDPNVPARNVGIKIYLQNGGQSAALSPNLGLLPLGLVLNGIGTGQSRPPLMPIAQNMFHQLSRTADKEGRYGTNGALESASVAPQSEYVYYFPDQITREQYEDMVQGRRAYLLWGRCEYCDALGNYTCHMFSLFWQGPPVNEFTKMTETNCAWQYGYPPILDPTQHNLLPCEQPEEREKREKYERDDLLKKAVDPPPKQK